MYDDILRQKWGKGFHTSFRIWQQIIAVPTSAHNGLDGTLRKHSGETVFFEFDHIFQTSNPQRAKILLI